MGDNIVMIKATANSIDELRGLIQNTVLKYESIRGVPICALCVKANFKYGDKNYVKYNTYLKLILVPRNIVVSDESNLLHCIYSNNTVVIMAYYYRIGKASKEVIKIIDASILSNGRQIAIEYVDIEDMRVIHRHIIDTSKNRWIHSLQDIIMERDEALIT